jgi:hypothetical protein
MANELFCSEQAAREADDHGAASALWAEAFADSDGEPSRVRVRYKKFREATLGGEAAQSSKSPAKPPKEQLARAPVQDGNPPPLAMSGYDFYRAACDEAHARLIYRP